MSWIAGAVLAFVFVAVAGEWYLNRVARPASA